MNIGDYVTLGIVGSLLLAVLVMKLLKARQDDVPLYHVKREVQ